MYEVLFMFLSIHKTVWLTHLKTSEPFFSTFLAGPRRVGSALLKSISHKLQRALQRGALLTSLQAKLHRNPLCDFNLKIIMLT